jgi:hypothetical protein
MRLIHPGDNNLRIMKFISLSICLVVTFSSIAFSQTKATTDPLKAYTKCKVPGDLEIKEVSRYPKSADKFRNVKTSNGAEKVSVADGYRVMFAYKDLFYYYANVKIEQSVPADYLRDKETVISSLKYFATAREATGMTFSEKSSLNGFEHYGIDRDRIDVGGQVGNHVLFYDPHQLIVTIYFLNQDDKNSLARAIVGGGERKFHNMDEYRTLRDDFLSKYSECLAKVAAAQP